jgi:hypothetical protein
MPFKAVFASRSPWDGTVLHYFSMTPGKPSCVQGRPVRELLADLLMAQCEPALALKEYEASRQVAPNRLRGFYGAAKAAGDKKKAATYMRSLL